MGPSAKPPKRIEFTGNHHSYLSILEHHDMSDLFKLLCADDELVVRSIISVDSAN